MKRTFEIVSGLIILIFMGVVFWQITQTTAQKNESMSNNLTGGDFPMYEEYSTWGPCPGPAGSCWERKILLTSGDYKVVNNQGTTTYTLGNDFVGKFAEIVKENNLQTKDCKASPVTDVWTSYYLYGRTDKISFPGCEEEMTLLKNSLNEAVDALEQSDEIDINYDTVSDPVPTTSVPRKPMSTTPPPEEPVACTMDAKECPDGSYVGREAPNCAFAECPVTPETSSKIITCTPESKLAEVCAEIYAPVCGLAEVQCITAPCDPIPQTYSNSCAACMENNVNSYTEGACEA